MRSRGVGLSGVHHSNQFEGAPAVCHQLHAQLAEHAGLSSRLLAFSLLALQLQFALKPADGSAVHMFIP